MGSLLRTPDPDWQYEHKAHHGHPLQLPLSPSIFDAPYCCSSSNSSSSSSSSHGMLASPSDLFQSASQFESLDIGIFDRDEGACSGNTA